MINQFTFFKDPKFSNSRFSPHLILSAGFTLVEVLTVFSITTFIAVSLLTSIIRAKPNLTEASQVLMSDIRMVQANALASKQFKDPATGVYSYRCGYGLSHFPTTNTSYFLYAGRVNSTGNCPGAKTYTSPGNTPIIFTRTLDSRLELELGGGQFRDIYFESPDGRISINNSSCPVGLGASESEITLKRKGGAACPSTDCRYVCVCAFGKIESRASECPDVAC